MWILQLNPMKGRAEDIAPIAWANTKEELEEFLKVESVEPYREDRWYKVYRKGGPLEWMNAPGPAGRAWIGVPAIVYVGSVEDWKSNAETAYYNLQNSLLMV